MTVAPIVVGALGAVTDPFEKYTGKLNVNISNPESCSVRNSWTIMERFVHLETSSKDYLRDLEEHVACSRG